MTYDIIIILQLQILLEVRIQFCLQQMKTYNERSRRLSAISIKRILHIINRRNIPPEFTPFVRTSLQAISLELAQSAWQRFHYEF